ncbi:MAG: hypothetical protein Q9219_007399 [cf. Caloplaca sp. 3 TL-2023]
MNSSKLSTSSFSGAPHGNFHGHSGKQMASPSIVDLGLTDNTSRHPDSLLDPLTGTPAWACGIIHRMRDRLAADESEADAQPILNSAIQKALQRYDQSFSPGRLAGGSQSSLFINSAMAQQQHIQPLGQRDRTPVQNADRPSGPNNMSSRSLPTEERPLLQGLQRYPADMRPLIRHLQRTFGKSTEKRNYEWPHKKIRCNSRFLAAREFSPFAPDADAVFVSDLIPKHYSGVTRGMLLNMFHDDAPYVPSIVMEVNKPGTYPSICRMDFSDHDILLGLDKHPFSLQGRGWPTNPTSSREHPRALPVEIFELIGEHLPRDSVQNMRLVNREFERKISRFAFRAVVIPFEPRIYGPSVAVAGDNYDPKKTHVKDGMRVFEQWGPEIQKFALTFEVPEGEAFHV